MFDKKAAAVGIDALSTAIIDLLHDNHEIAFNAIKRDSSPLGQIAQLLTNSQDVAALATALRVLSRKLTDS